MGTLSSVCVDVLRRADRHRRLSVLYPEDARLAGNQYVNVHAKLMIVDGACLRVGSANLNNRSMGLDTECDVIVDAQRDARVQARISALLLRLVAHHLGAEAAAVQAAWSEHGSLAAAIAALGRGRPKSLEPYQAAAKLGALDSLLADVELIDPPKPIGIERLVDEFVFRGRAARDLPLRERVPTGLLLTLFFCVVLAVTRFMTPLSPYLREASFRRMIAALHLAGPAELWFLVGFIGLGLLFVPLNLLIILAACLFPIPKAFALTLVGSAVLAACGYGLGRMTAADLMARVLGKTMVYLRQATMRYSTLAIFLVRFFPIAPFAMMNLAAGQARVALAPYFGGTILGLLPGTLALLAFHRSLLLAIDHPGPTTSLTFALVVLAIAVAFYLLARRLGRVGRELPAMPGATP
jgi:uncharacterized membrane protein YdjX (TVP38/TMEM64 family)